METKTNTVQTVTVKALDFSDLLTGAALAAHKKTDLPSINAVNLSASDCYLMAAATDRYRLITGELGLDDSAATLDASLIPLAAVKRIAAAIKGLPKAGTYSPNLVTISRAGDILTVQIGSDTLSINLEGGSFPKYSHLFPADPVAVNNIGFNPAYMADIAKIPTSNRAGAIVNLTLHGENKPATFTVPHDSIKWRGLLMPMRVKA